MARYDETEELAALLSALPPAPVAWVRGAQELPIARSRMDDLVQRAREDVELRRRLVDDLERALADEGVQPNPSLVDTMRNRLASD